MELVENLGGNVYGPLLEQIHKSPFFALLHTLNNLLLMSIESSFPSNFYMKEHVAFGQAKRIEESQFIL